MFHEESVRIPMILRDPRATADASRGTVSSALVEAIDLVPTFLDALDDGRADRDAARTPAGGTGAGHRWSRAPRPPWIFSDEIFAECRSVFGTRAGTQRVWRPMRRAASWSARPAGSIIYNLLTAIKPNCSISLNGQGDRRSRR